MQSLSCKVALFSILLVFCVNSRGLPFYFDPMGKLSGSSAWSPLSLSPVAWWKGNGNALDSASTNNAVWTGTPSYETGVNGLAFSMSNTYAMASSMSIYEGATNLTVCGWVNITGKGNGHATYDSLFGFGADYGPIFFTDATTIKFRRTTLISTAKPSGWVHLTATYNNKFIVIYTNGLLASTTDYMTSVPDRKPFGIGRASDRTWTAVALFDDVMFFDRALTTNEVKQIYNWRQ